MPFIFRCPSDECGRFLLLEDDERGESIQCLCCKQVIDVALEMEIVDPEIVAPRPNPSIARTNGQRIIERACPKCAEAITFPEEKRRQAVQCPNCDYWGILN